MSQCKFLLYLLTQMVYTHTCTYITYRCDFKAMNLNLWTMYSSYPHHCIVTSYFLLSPKFCSNSTRILKLMRWFLGSISIRVEEIIRSWVNVKNWIILNYSNKVDLWFYQFVMLKKFWLHHILLKINLRKIRDYYIRKTQESSEAGFRKFF